MLVSIARNIYISPTIFEIRVLNPSISRHYCSTYNHNYIEKFFKKL